VKTESSGDTSVLSGKKRNREEANSNNLPCQSELSSLPAHHGCSATCLCAPPGFKPKPAHKTSPGRYMLIYSRLHLIFVPCDIVFLFGLPTRACRK
jgi:hypothetical protein